MLRMRVSGLCAPADIGLLITTLIATGAVVDAAHFRTGDEVEIVLREPSCPIAASRLAGVLETWVSRAPLAQVRGGHGSDDHGTR